MDLIKFRDKYHGMAVSPRNMYFSEAIAWLESTQRPKVKPEHLSFLVEFENELQKALNEKNIPPSWFLQIGRTYSPFPFFDAFLRKFC